LEFGLRTSEETGSSGSDQTGLLTRDGLSADTRTVTDVGMVTTTVGMVNGIHVHGFDLRPAWSSHFVFVIGDTGFQDGLLGSSATSDESDHGTGFALDSLSGARGKSDSGLGAIFGVTDDGAVGSGGSGQVSSVGIVGFDVAHQGTFGDLAHGEDVADGESGLFTAVNVLAGVHTFSADEIFCVLLIAISISKADFGDGSSSSAVMDDFFNNTFNITVSFSIVKVSKLRLFHTVMAVSFENTFRVTPSLISNNSTHYSIGFDL
jgi:hypothetical protein